MADPIAALDFRKPNYGPILDQRIEAAARLENASAEDIEALKGYYRENLVAFIQDWGVTYEPRSLEDGRAAVLPFILFPRQIECVEEILDSWKNKRPLLIEKSRDCGISWVTVAVGASMCCLYDGFRIGFGSRKQEYVDLVDEPKSLFWKARFFMRYIPAPFAGGYREEIDSPFMRMRFPETGSSMTGEVGDDIGRGDRTSIYFVDESAYLKRPKKVDASLSQTTNCRIDVSSVNGMNNSFARRRFGGKVPVFIFDWRDDPRKDEAWYEKQVAELDPIVVAQEIDRDYQASVEGVVIPVKWINAAKDAREKLGISLSGKRALAFDVADEGKDKNAVVAATGIEIDYAEEWSGKGDDIFGSVERVFEICDEMELEEFIYDADGLGAGVRGDARVINARRTNAKQRTIGVVPYRGSESVRDPKKDNILKGRKNEDVFWNLKAQAWWSLRVRFQKTYRWVVDGVPCDPNEIVSIDTKKCKNHAKLTAELGQAIYRADETTGKFKIEKKPDDTVSPNMADAAVMRMFGGNRHRVIVPKSALLATSLRRR